MLGLGSMADAVGRGRRLDASHGVDKIENSLLMEKI